MGWVVSSALLSVFAFNIALLASVAEPSATGDGKGKGEKTIFNVKIDKYQKGKRCQQSITVKGGSVDDTFNGPCSSEEPNIIDSDDFLLVGDLTQSRHTIYSDSPNTLIIIKRGICRTRTYENEKDKLRKITKRMKNSECKEMNDKIKKLVENSKQPVLQVLEKTGQDAIMKPSDDLETELAKYNLLNHLSNLETLNNEDTIPKLSSSTTNSHKEQATPQKGGLQTLSSKGTLAAGQDTVVTAISPASGKKDKVWKKFASDVGSAFSEAVVSSVKPNDKAGLKV